MQVTTFNTTPSNHPQSATQDHEDLANVVTDLQLHDGHAHTVPNVPNNVPTHPAEVENPTEGFSDTDEVAWEKVEPPKLTEEDAALDLILRSVAVKADLDVNLSIKDALPTPAPAPATTDGPALKTTQMERNSGPVIVSAETLASALQAAQISAPAAVPISHSPATSPPPQSAATIGPPPAQEYLLKTIDWFDFEIGVEKVVKVITQNENGPCPLLALCNVLILRGDIAITPFERPSVTYNYLVQLLGDYLLNHMPSPAFPSSPTGRNYERVVDQRKNLNAALSILPNLQTGLDVNVHFTSIRDFVPTPELDIFKAFHTDLVHGWVVDPAIKDSLTTSQFLDSTATQLTYYGLQLLTDSLPDSRICVFFRNNHFSTLYKHPTTSTLFVLVTDAGLVSERQVVWESLGDIDQGNSEFYDGWFCRVERATGGDYVNGFDGTGNPSEDMDFALALSLQQQEEEAHREEQARRRGNSRASNAWSGGASSRNSAPPRNAGSTSATRVDAHGRAERESFTAAEKITTQIRQDRAKEEEEAEAAKKKEKKSTECIIS